MAGRKQLQCCIKNSHIQQKQTGGIYRQESLELGLLLTREFLLPISVLTVAY